MKILNEPIEIEHCGECPYTEVRDKPKKVIWYCLKLLKDIPDLWGEIPEWCPLPNKEDPIKDFLKKHPEAKRVEIEGFLKEVEPKIREDERERLLREIGGVNED